MNTATNKKRVKRIYDTNEVPHLWANQSLTRNYNSYYDGANPRKNLFYQGASIYSYGRHFEIARIIKEDVILFTTGTRSNTTARHLRLTRYAIDRSKYKVIHVCYFRDIKGDFKGVDKQNVKFYIDKIKELIDKQHKARTYDYSSNILEWVINLKNYVELFKVYKNKQIKRYLTYTSLDKLPTVAERTEEDEAKIRALKREKAREARKHNKLGKERTLEWLEGKIRSSHLVNSKYIGKEGELLRVKGDRIETNEGATMLLKDAQMLWGYIYQAFVNKSGYTPDIGIPFGNYTLNWIDKKGNCKIGCHKIRFSESERIAKELKWIE